MKFTLKYKLFSVYDRYDVFDEGGNILYKIKGKNGKNIAGVSRKFYEMTSTYTIDIDSEKEENIIAVFLFTIAADTKKIQTY